MLKHLTLSFIAFLMIGYGCSSNAPQIPIAAPIKPPTVKPKVEKKAEVPSLFDRTDDYSYNPIGKRDPFMAYTEEAVVEDASIPKSPLERYSLDQLKITAIVWGLSDPRAMIFAPDNQNYIVRTNTRVGKNRGRVSKITKRSVFIEEEYRDPTGKLVVNEQELEIRPEEKKSTEDLQLKMVDE